MPVRFKSKQCRITLGGAGTRGPPIYVSAALLDLRAVQDGWSSGVKTLIPD
jgi:hypothetical protein